MSQKTIVNPGFPGFERYTFSPAVIKSGKMLFISGTTATDDSGNIIGRGDIKEQTRVIFEKFKRILESVGASMDDIVQTTDYIVTTDGYRETADIRREFFQKDFPAATGVIVAGLLRVEALIEIDAIAVVD